MNYFNFEVEAGMDYVASFTYRDESTGLPKDLTGYSALFYARDGEGGELVMQFDNSANKILLNANPGSVDIYFVPSDTTGIEWEQAHCHVVLTDPFGVKEKLIKGLLTVVGVA